MSAFDEAVSEQETAAAERVADRADARHEKIKLLQQPGGIILADTPERIATRVDRLSRYHSQITPVTPAEIEGGDDKAMATVVEALEKVINSEDFLSVAYLEAGARASRAVGRVNIRDRRGRLQGYGTASMVSPLLALTNHHVLPDFETAATSTIEFDFQDGIDGQPLQPRVFAFAPGRFFVADEGLDFAVVAVEDAPPGLGTFGFNPLIEAEGKAIIGDFVTIVQHPGGERKQVALRENRIVDLPELFVHYETDTEPGSSGSPVFNDQWEVTALHHASVPAPDHAELGHIMNEGIRVSRLLRRLGEIAPTLPQAQQELIADLSAAASSIDPVSASTESSDRPSSSPTVGERSDRTTGPASATSLSPSPALQVTVPLEITVRQGADQPEAITIDPDYTTRGGYDPGFLGADHPGVPLPTLDQELLPLTAVNQMADGEPRYVLSYHHFSVVMNRQRRLAFFTAVNIDGSSSHRLKRESDRWSLDPRVSADEQTNDALYAGNPLDRGHLVRRLDPAWGPSPDVAKLANDDTFHFTNCSPQHEDFNQNTTTWAGLEDYILENADNRDFKVSVFTGPVFADDDDLFHELQLPRQFWKVVAMVATGGSLSATAYLLSQEELIRGLERVPEEFSYGAYETFQVPVSRIEELTRLSFGSLRDFDPMTRLEADRPVLMIDRSDQILL